MKKRSIAVLLILVLLVVMTACGKPAETKEEEKPEQTMTQETQSETKEEEHHDHEHGDFEWIGEYGLKAGTYLLHFGPCADKTMDVGFVKMGENIKDLEHHASHVMAAKDKEVIKQEETFEAKSDFAYTLEMDPEHGHIHFTIKEDGKYALITEHLPKESTMQIFDAEKKEILPVEEKEIEGHKH